MSTQVQDQEWRDGYRDGLTAALVVAQTCVDDPSATPSSVVELLEALAGSPVIAPEQPL